MNGSRTSSSWRMMIMFVVLAAGTFIVSLTCVSPRVAAADTVDIVILPIGDSNTLGFGKGGNSGTADNYASYRYWLYEDLQTTPLIDEFRFAGSMMAGFDPAKYTESWETLTPEKVKFIGWASQTSASIDSCVPATNAVPPNGWCLKDGLQAAGLGSNDEVIALVMLGTNDVDKSINGSAANQGWGNASRAAFTGILDKLAAQDVGSMKVVLAKILPGELNEPPKHLLTSERIAHFNNGLAAWCQPQGPANQCTGSDIPSGISVYLADMNTGFTLDDLHDKVHTSQAGEEKVAQVWLDAIELAIKESEPPVPGLVAEQEPNNGRASANRVGLNDLVTGFVEEKNGACGNDFFQFTLPHTGFVVVKSDAKPLGSPLSPTVKLLDQDGKQLAQSAAYEGADPILFHSLYPGTYYVAVGEAQSGKTCGSDYKYELYVSSPVLLSASAYGLKEGGRVGGVSFFSEDILAWTKLNTGEERWAMLFDGSDVGIHRNIDNIAAEGGNKGNLLLTVHNNDNVPGIGSVTPWDFFMFEPTRLGEHTAGTFRWGLAGNLHELEVRGERIDAIDGWVYGYEADPFGGGCFGFPISTLGAAGVKTWGDLKMLQDNEDVFCRVYDESSGGWRPWDYFFDINGKRNAPESETITGDVPGLREKNVFAIAYDDAADIMYLVVRPNGEVFGHQVTQKDIFAVTYPGYNWGGIYWHGPDHGWNYPIDGIELNGW